jgi:probable rRNA maturation factor
MQFPDLPFEAPESVISFHMEDVEFDLPSEDTLVAWLVQVAALEGAEMLELNYIFCSDEYLRHINVEYLDHDYYTDVISFPYAETGIHGDVFISTERVAENAVTNGVSFETELCRVMVHGLLHLAGYDDKTPEAAQQMRSMEDKYLKIHADTHLR